MPRALRRSSPQSEPLHQKRPGDAVRRTERAYFTIRVNCATASAPDLAAARHPRTVLRLHCRRSNAQHAGAPRSRSMARAAGCCHSPDPPSLRSRPPDGPVWQHLGPFHASPLPRRAGGGTSLVQTQPGRPPPPARALGTGARTDAVTGQWRRAYDVRASLSAMLPRHDDFASHARPSFTPAGRCWKPRDLMERIPRLHLRSQAPRVNTPALDALAQRRACARISRTSLIACLRGVGVAGAATSAATC